MAASFQKTNKKHNSNTSNLSTYKNAIAINDELTKYRQIIEGNSDGIIATDTGGIITMWNKGAEKIYGYKKEEAVGQPITIIYKEKDYPLLKSMISELLQGNNIDDVEVTALRKDKKEISVLVSLSTIKDDDGNIVELAGITKDITDQKVIEKTLQIERDRTRQYLDVAEVMMIGLDRDGRITFINSKGCKILGYEKDELVGSDWFSNFIPKKQIPEIRRVFTSLLAGNIEPVKFYECPVVCKDGSEKSVAWHNSIVRDSDGNIVGTFSSGEDTTEKKMIERTMQRYFEMSSELICQADINTATFTNINPGFKKTLGYSEEELISKSFLNFIHPDDKDSTLQVINEQLQRGEKVLSFINRYRCKDGSYVLLDWNSHPVPEEGFTYAVARDVTEQKEIEKKLLESEGRLKAVLDNSPFSVAVVDESDNNILYWSKSARNLFGHHPKTAQEWYQLAYPDPEYRQEIMKRWKPLLEKAKKVSSPVNAGEHEISCKDGSVKICEIYAQFIPGNLVVTLNDITQQKKIENELLHAKLASEEYINSIPGLFYVFDESRFVQWNRAWNTMIGYSDIELKEMYGPDFFVGSDRDNIAKAMKTVFDRGQVDIEANIITRDGRSIPYYFTGDRVQLNGQPHLIGLGIDISQLKEAETQLKKSEDKFRSYASASPNGIFVTNRSGYYIDVNEAASKITGYSRDELLTKHFLDFVPTESHTSARKCFEEMLKTGSSSIEIEFVKKDKSLGWWSINGVKLENDKFLAVVSDLTETKRLRELESRASRLQTAGTIAGQVAHDFNNLLGPIIAYPELIREEIPGNEAALSYLDYIENAGKKIAEINQDLLTMGRRGHYTQSVLDLNQVVMQAVAQVKGQLDTIIYNLDLNDALLKIKGGEAQLQRAIINILNNACDAMHYRGEITIQTENCSADDLSIEYGQVPKGEYIKLSISDTGCGISDCIKNKILDPFFTTKVTDKKRGSGLGMSVVDSVIKDHNGYIDLSSEIGVGTSFYLYFPVCREKGTDSNSDMAINGGRESLLIVDDDENQRDVTSTILGKLGYTIHTVDCGEEAIDFLRENSVDLLILDMIMPKGIDGAETFRRAKEINPDQKAIIISGFSEDDRIIEAKNLGLNAFIVKPFTRETIARAVTSALENSVMV